MSGFPAHRPRRMRRTETLRSLVRETRLAPGQLVPPLFLRAGEGVREEVASLPGVHRTSPDEAERDVAEAVAAGIRAVLLFGVVDPSERDAEGSGAWAEDGVVQAGVRRLREAFPELAILTDVCLCEYTSHGHCGVLEEGGGGGPRVANDETLGLLARTAVSQAEAGADLVAPSDMMDGRVAAIRDALDDAGHEQVGILSYAVKYASAFYGPFRDAAGSAPREGDRRGYQMDPANAEEALREAWADVDEGADVLMVKPALPCLDVVRRVKEETGWPVAAYHVSGEYASLKAAAERGWLDFGAVLEESLLSIRRAGADLIVTYGAVEAARRLSR